MGSLVLCLCAFADASFLPFPITTLFLFIILINTRMIYRNLFFTLLGTIAGALAGYSAGHFLWIKPDGEFTGIVQFLFNHVPGFSEVVYEKVHALYTKWDFWILAAATVTPLPYGMFSVTSGVFNINIFIFFSVTLVCQTIKYSFLTLVITKVGPKAKRMMKFSWKPVAVFSAAVLLVILITNILQYHK